MLLPGRHANTSDYRYGFGGQELDNEIKGEGNHINYEDRVYDPRIGRWGTTDMKNKSFQSNYVFGMDNPIIFKDPDGKDDYYFDNITGAVYIIRNGEPNRYFVTEYVFEDNPGSPVNTGTPVNIQYKVNDPEIKFRRIRGNTVFRDALKHAASPEHYESIYHSYDSIDEDAILLGTIGLPVGIIIAAEVGVIVILEETAEYVFEELTGVPVVVDPIDLIEQGVKKGGKELVDKGIEQTIKKGKDDVATKAASKGSNVKKGDIKFDPETTKAAQNLGINPSQVSIKNGVANTKIDIAWSTDVSSVRALERGLKANGAKSLKIDSGPIVNPDLLKRISERHVAGKKYLGFDIKQTGINSFELIKKL